MQKFLCFAGMMIVGAYAFAGNVEIINAEFTKNEGSWRVGVTLKHGDTGWDHYADAWRVVSKNGDVLGTRKLLHPHENEQPFTRYLSSVTIPKGDIIVYVEAHDKVHGWAKQRLEVDLSKSSGERYKVKR